MICRAADGAWPLRDSRKAAGAGLVRGSPSAGGSRRRIRGLRYAARPTLGGKPLHDRRWCDQIPTPAENQLYPCSEHSWAHRHSHGSRKLFGDRGRQITENPELLSVSSPWTFKDGATSGGLPNLRGRRNRSHLETRDRRGRAGRSPGLTRAKEKPDGLKRAGSRPLSAV